MGVREVSDEGGEVRERWGGEAREVRWARWKIMWKSSRESGMVARDPAIPALRMMLSDAFPSSIFGKR